MQSGTFYKPAKIKAMYEYKIIETTHRYTVKSDKSALAVVVTSYIGAEPDAKEGYINMDDKDNMYVI